MALSTRRRNVTDIGWRILVQSGDVIHSKEVAVSGVSFNWPVEVEITVNGQGDSVSKIDLLGTIIGN